MRKVMTLSFVLMSASAAMAQCECCTPATVTQGQDLGSHVAVPIQSPALTLSEFNKLLPFYLRTQEALAEDDLEGAMSAGSAMAKTASNFTGEAAKRFFMAADTIAKATSLKIARTAFRTASDMMIATASTVDLPENAGIYLANCPMALENSGASWLQDDSLPANPYFGAMMLRCGTIRLITR